MKFNTTKKEKSTFIAPGISESEGEYIICPDCENDRSLLLTEKEPGRRIEWHCRGCRKYLGGVVQEDGTIERLTVAPKRKWILVEIDAGCDPIILTGLRSPVIFDDDKQCHPSDDFTENNDMRSYNLRSCPVDTDVNPLGYPQFKCP